MAWMDVDGLYGLPLERFVPERGALARELRGAGRREEAATVAALRKPSLAAWAVNQLVRTQQDAVAELFAAGDALRDVQSGVLAGRADARALRAGAEAERAAVAALVDTAGGLLSSGGHELSEATLDRVAETLHAAALDDDARRVAGEGRLERELRHVGLGVAAGSTSAPAPPKRAARSPSAPKATAEGRRAAREEAKATEEAARQRQQARRQAHSAEREAQREVERTDRALRAATQHHERAVDTLHRAEEELAKARAQAQAAADIHRRAQQQLEAT
jgi:hypothetical protein